VKITEVIKMQKMLMPFVLTFLVSGLVSCNNHSSTVIADNNIVIVENKSHDISDWCAEWERIHELLSKDDKNTLQKEGVVHSSDNKYEHAYYVLSPQLVSSCEQRVKIGGFIWMVVLGLDTETDEEFAQRNSKEIVKVLRHIWDSPAFSSDGVHHEKYSLLTYKGVKDEEIAPFIGELLKKERTPDMEDSLEFTLLTRPLPSLMPIVSELLKKAENEGNVFRQVYYLIILHQTTPNSLHLTKLDKMTRSRKLSNETRNGLTEIINKFKSGKKIDYEDVEKLNLQLFEDY
jgi:hypothetical protein